MAKRQEIRRSRKPLIQTTAVVAILGVLGTLAVFADGFDAQEVPALETSVWVTRDDGQYARVNTDLAEIDTVREVQDPTGVVQAGSDSVVFSQGYRQLWPVDVANPVDLIAQDTAATTPTEPAEDDDQSTGSDAAADAEPGDEVGPSMQNTPPGTREVVSAGDFLLYLTDTGSVFVSGLVGLDGELPVAAPINPFANVPVEEGEEPPTYTANAVAIDDTGKVVLYSAAEEAVRLFDANTFEFSGSETAVPSPPGADARLELALVGGSWVMSSPADGTVWVDGLDEPVDAGLGGEARLQSSTPVGNVAYLADAEALVSIAMSTGTVERVAEGNGVPAAPVVVGGVAYAAWLSSDVGTLWSSEANSPIQLEIDGDVLEEAEAIVPAFRTNGERAVLNETVSGMLWTIPDGTLIPVNQWDLDEEDQTTGTIVVEDVAQQEPPVAVADAFGVRRGQLVVLPVLLNDHDPNKKDVLSIVPESIQGGLGDPAFGDLSLVSSNQQSVIRVRAEAGSTTFGYAVTDGAAESAPTSVTLTVVPDDQNSAPVWCGVNACQQDWPTPQVSPGGTVKVPVLTGWVDPEGDPIALTEVRKDNENDAVSVVATDDGSVAIRHNDPNAPDSVISLTVTVSDSRGAATETALSLTVSSNPALVANPVAVVGGVDEKITIPIADHVTGGSGAYRVLDAVETASAASGLVVVPNAAAGTIELTGSEPGEYLVNYSVQDSATLAEQSALIRVTILGGNSPLSIAPITAFVRANEDSTVDVLSAVQNTTGRVLIVTEASTGDPGLSISVVGQSRVRVSGATPDGNPGLIGTANIVVSDGGSSTVEGQVTVFLVPSTTSANPIAVPDTATVRAGAQVDIPVLANDLGPRGERLIVHPDLTPAGTAGELVFAGEGSVRYLAPSAPGIYTVRYTAYLEGQPERLDSTTITVTVLPPGSNRAPQPPILTARAIAGQTVVIPVDPFGIDPDGDSVILQSVDMPPAGQGVPSVSADGRSILYAAPASGIAGGQMSFNYTVRDSEGADATGVVRVGVLSAELTDVTPVTYSDYVRVQAGSTVPVTVLPLLDDRDPSQGTLELIDIVPNAPNTPDNPEYGRLSGLIDASATSLEDGEVVVRAGDVLGTHSYVYTVQSSVSTSTAQGLIVVNVTDGVAPDKPIVTDTILTAKDRNELPSGIDVVSGKVQWASGSVDSLKLSLWGDNSSGFRVSGSKISGELPADGALVPFTLTGSDAAGAEVVSHGFLRIPAFNDMRVQVSTSVEPIEVAEEKSIEFSIRELLDLDSNEKVEIKDDRDYIVQRENGACVPGGSGEAVYDAGREAPWVDSCTIPVRLDGQKQWTMISIPVEIAPKDPQAILNSLTRTIAPGASETIALYEDMTTWEGGRVGDIDVLTYTAAFAGSSFIVSQQGNSVVIDTRADARPGSRETIEVVVPSYGGLSAVVTLIVGVAPTDAPRGATFTQVCDVSKGPSCSVQLIGAAGEYDPFAGKVGSGLSLVSIGGGSTVSCSVASVSTAGKTSIVASWPGGAKPAGGECVVPYTVQDAQGRTGPGQVTLDVLGYPQPPSTVMTTAYTGSSVTLTVPLGGASQAHPSISTVSIWENGEKVAANCNPGGPGSWNCVVEGLVNGAKHTYTARAQNTVGDSTDTTPVQTWAYQAPTITSLTADPVYDTNRTSLSTGAVDLKIAAGDDAVSFRVVENNQSVPRTGAVTTVPLSMSPGSHAIQVIPISQFQPPIGNAGSEGELKTVTVVAAGSPSYVKDGDATSEADTITISGVEMSTNSSALPTNQIYVLWRGAEPTCVMTGGGGIGISGGASDAVTQTGGTFTGLAEYTDYYVKACGTNGYGAASSKPHHEQTYRNPGTPSGELTYTVATAPTADGAQYVYGLSVAPAPTPRSGWTTTYFFDGVQSQQFSLNPDVVNGSITVADCRGSIIGQRCSSHSAITALTAPTTVIVTFPSSCVSEPTGDDIQVTAGASGYATRSVSAVDPATSKVTYTVSFGGPFSSLESISHAVCFTPPPPPPPDPTPSPTPTP